MGDKRGSGDAGSFTAEPEKRKRRDFMAGGSEVCTLHLATQIKRGLTRLSAKCTPPTPGSGPMRMRTGWVMALQRPTCRELSSALTTVYSSYVLSGAAKVMVAFIPLPTRRWTCVGTVFVKRLLLQYLTTNKIINLA